MSDYERLSKCVKYLDQVMNSDVVSAYTIEKAGLPTFLDGLDDASFAELNRLLRDSNMHLIDMQETYVLILLSTVVEDSKRVEPLVVFKDQPDTMQHVDEFVDYEFRQHEYARFFFLMHRLPAVLQYDFSQWIEPHRLYCTYEGKRWRCTGASRMGDVWLTDNFDQDCGYKLRVAVNECSDWSDTATPDQWPTTLTVKTDALVKVLLDLVNFPRPEVCRHLVGTSLLNALALSGIKVPDALIDAFARDSDGDRDALRLLKTLLGAKK